MLDESERIRSDAELQRILDADPTELNFDKTALTNAMIERLVAHLKGNKSLTTLSLRKNGLQEYGAQLIMTLFVNGNLSLKILNISENNFGNDNVECFARAAAFDACLLSLDLSNNEYDKTVGQSFVDMVNDNFTLQQFNCSEIDADARSSIDEALAYNRSLDFSSYHDVYHAFLRALIKFAPEGQDGLTDLERAFQAYKEKVREKLTFLNTVAGRKDEHKAKKAKAAISEHVKLLQQKIQKVEFIGSPRSGKSKEHSASRKLQDMSRELNELMQEFTTSNLSSPSGSPLRVSSISNSASLSLFGGSTVAAAAAAASVGSVRDSTYSSASSVNSVGSVSSNGSVVPLLELRDAQLQDERPSLLPNDAPPLVDSRAVKMPDLTSPLQNDLNLSRARTIDVNFCDELKAEVETFIANLTALINLDNQDIPMGEFCKRIVSFYQRMIPIKEFYPEKDESKAEIETFYQTAVKAVLKALGPGYSPENIVPTRKEIRGQIVAYLELRTGFKVREEYLQIFLNVMEILAASSHEELSAECKDMFDRHFMRFHNLVQRMQLKSNVGTLDHLFHRKKVASFHEASTKLDELRGTMNIFLVKSVFIDVLLRPRKGADILLGERRDLKRVDAWILHVEPDPCHTDPSPSSPRRGKIN